MSLITTAWMIVASLFLRGQARSRMGRVSIMHLFRLYLAILHALHIVRVDLKEIDSLRADAGLILAPNHPSLLDALLVASRLPNVVCIMKATVLKNPLFGKGAQIAGYIPNESLREIVNLAEKEVKHENHVLLFPEGTRTVRDASVELKGSLGIIAKRTNVPVQTLIIETDSCFLGKERHILNPPDFPVHFRVKMGRRFPPPHDVKLFMEELESYFECILNKQRPSRNNSANAVDSVTLQN